MNESSKERTLGALHRQNEKIISQILDNIRGVARMREQRNELVFTEQFLKEHAEVMQRLSDLTGMSVTALIAKLKY